METMMENLWNQISQTVNFEFLLSFILLGYLAKRYLKKQIEVWVKHTVPMVYIVLIIASLLMIPFRIFGVGWKQLFITYTVATSLHELFFQWIEKMIRNEKH